MTKYQEVPVEDLEPGMLTETWEVIGRATRVGDEWVLDMRHRIDGGQSAIAYPLEHRVRVEVLEA